MPKPVRTHPRGAAGVTAVCSLGLLLACCGCPGMLWKPELPKAVSIVIQADGSITIDGQPAGPREQWAELLKKKTAARKAALQAAAAPAVPLAPNQQPREALINIASPEKTQYEVFCQVLLACKMACVSDLDLEGVPFTAPGSSSPRPGTNMFMRPLAPPFLPMEVRSTADLKRLQEHAAEMDRGGILLDGTFDCPMDLVIAAAKASQEIGVPVAFTISHKYAFWTFTAPLVLKYTGVDGRGKFLFDFASAFEGLAPIRPTFFSVPLGDPPRSIVFVLDRSGSMTDIIDLVKYVTKRCIGALAESDQFDVLFFASGPPPEGPGRGLFPATERNKQLAFEFIDGVIAQGETDPVTALQRAFAAEPKVIVVLTDGEFDPQVARLVKDLNKDGKVKVHTIGFLYKTSEAILKQIAAENGGVYRFISEADLAALLENLR